MGEDGEEEKCSYDVELVLVVLVGAFCNCWLYDHGNAWIDQ